MKSKTVDPAELADALAGLRQELGRLGERVAALEAAAGANPRSPAAAAAPAPAAATPAPAPPPPQPEPLGEEIVLVLTAAVAAYLGVKPHVRQIRLLGSAAWAQQGRATIQASHSLPVQHG